MIGADGLVFDFLPSNDVRTVGEEEKEGINLRGLRQAFEADFAEMPSASINIRTLYRKSIISFSAAKVQEGEEIFVYPQAHFDLFEIPASSVDKPLPLTNCEAWFQARAEELARTPRLKGPS